MIAIFVHIWFQTTECSQQLHALLGKILINRNKIQEMESVVSGVIYLLSFINQVVTRAWLKTELS